MQKLTAYADLDKFDPFITLVRMSQTEQHNQITLDQYDLLLSQYLSAQEIRYPIFGWFYGRRAFLDKKLLSSGITIRRPLNGHIWPHRAGFIGVVDAEQAIIKSKRY